MTMTTMSITAKTPTTTTTTRTTKEASSVLFRVRRKTHTQPHIYARTLPTYCIILNINISCRHITIIIMTIITIIIVITTTSEVVERREG